MKHTTAGAKESQAIETSKKIRKKGFMTSPFTKMAQIWQNPLFESCPTSKHLMTSKVISNDNYACKC